MISSYIRSQHQSHPKRILRKQSGILRSSLFAMLHGTTATHPRIEREERMETIRAHMMDSIGLRINEYPQLARRIRHAPDIQVLWYLRGDLMGMLAAEHGETEARRKVAALTRMFEGLLPRGLKSRPSPLG
ncbi:hypothetical protein BH11PSE7_BH11PSE7_10580 [soil metagenome]